MTIPKINDLKKKLLTKNSDVELMNMYQYYTSDIRNVKLASTQRGPAWNDNDINIFLSDVYNENNDENKKINKEENTKKSKKNNLRFFGSILLSGNKNNKSHKLIDGQQRTTSGLLFIAAIRDILKGMPNPNHRITSLKHLCNKLLFNTPEYSNKSHIFLDLTNNDDNGKYASTYAGAFNTIINGTFSNKSIRNSSYQPVHLINSAYASIKENIDNSFDRKTKRKNKIDKLYKLSYTFLQKFVVTIIRLSPRNFNNYITFETTNDRGKDLTVADKVKSHLLMITTLKNDNPRLYNTKRFKDNWKHISKLLQGNANIISNFIIDLWHARSTHCSGKKVPSKIRKDIPNIAAVKGLMKDLYNLVNVYKSLLHPMSRGSKFNKSYKEDKYLYKVKYMVQELDDMGLKQYYPLILSMYNYKYKNKDIYLVMSRVMEIEMRRQILHEVHAPYITEAHDIWNNNSLLKVNDIINGLTKYNLSDTATQTACTIYNHRYINKSNNKSMRILTYMLAKVYDHISNDFNNSYDQLYTDIFTKTENKKNSHKKEYKYQAIHISKNKIRKSLNKKNNTKGTNILFNNIGNWTLLEKEKLSGIDPKNPDPITLQEALNESDLNCNKDISSYLLYLNNKKKQNKKDNKNKLVLSDFRKIIKHRVKRISNAYVNTWIQHTKSKQDSNKNSNKNK